MKDKDVTASELLMLDSEPWRKYTSKCHMRDEVLCDKAIAKVVMNKDGSGRSKRSKSHGNLMNEKTEEISRYLARAYKIADSKVGETYHALKDYGLKLKDVFQGEDNQPLHKPPFALEYLRECTNQEGDNILFSDLMIQYKPGNAQQFESMISNICSFKFWDASEFASTCNNDLCLDTAIGVGSLSRLMPGSWFTGDLIKLVVDFIFRRKNSEIHNIAVLHDYVLDPIFGDNYFSTEDILKERFCEASIRVLKNAKNKKIYDKRIWIIIDNSEGIHWRIVVLFNPCRFFNGDENEKQIFYVMDSMKNPPTPGTKYHSSVFISWMLFHFYVENTNNRILEEYKMKRKEDFWEKYGPTKLMQVNNKGKLVQVTDKGTQNKGKANKTRMTATRVAEKKRGRRRKVKTQRKRFQSRRKVIVTRRTTTTRMKVIRTSMM